MFGNHGLGGLLEEGAHGKSPKCLNGNLGDFGEFCKGLRPSENFQTAFRNKNGSLKATVFCFKPYTDLSVFSASTDSAV